MRICGIVKGLGARIRNMAKGGGPRQGEPEVLALGAGPGPGPGGPPGPAGPPGPPPRPGSRPRPYDIKPTRPTSQLAARIGLWAAVVVGSVAGLIGMVTPSGGDSEPTVVQQTQQDGLPAPVATLAQRAVRAWLESGDLDQDDPRFAELQELFVEMPGSAPSAEGLTVGPVTAVSGGVWEEGYWLVTLAVEVYECVPVDEEGEAEDDVDEEEAQEPALPIDCSEETVEAEAGEDEDEVDGEDEAPAPTPTEPAASTWFVEVGVVGQLDGGMAALTTPAVVPPPPPVEEGWASSGNGAAPPSTDEPIATTVEDFLRAWVAGGGDLSRYLAPEVEAQPIDPAPFTDLALVQIAYEEQEPGRVQTRAHAQVTTPGGTELVVAYELVVVYRDDRWEVSEYWGAPSLGGRPGEDEQAGEGAGSDEDSGSTGSTGSTGSSDDTGSTGSTGSSDSTGSGDTGSDDTGSGESAGRTEVVQ